MVVADSEVPGRDHALMAPFRRPLLRLSRNELRNADRTDLGRSDYRRSVSIERRPVCAAAKAGDLAAGDLNARE